MPLQPWVPPALRPIDRTRRTHRRPLHLATLAAVILATPFFAVPTPVARALGPAHIDRAVTPVPASTTVAGPATTTTTEPASVPPVLQPGPGPQPAPMAPPATAVPAPGRATATGCGPALAYLTAYAAPGFQLLCPGNAQGHQATTCYSSDPCAPGQALIIIADPCPVAYMNEAANSWAILKGGVIDPYGACPS